MVSFEILKLFHAEASKWPMHGSGTYSLAPQNISVYQPTSLIESARGLVEVGAY